MASAFAPRSKYVSLYFASCCSSMPIHKFIQRHDTRRKTHQCVVRGVVLCPYGSNRKRLYILIMCIMLEHNREKQFHMGAPSESGIWGSDSEGAVVPI